MSKAIRIALAFFLLTSAALKVQSVLTDPLAQDGLLSSPRIQIATIQIEILLGLWLSSGLAARGAWAVTLGFFAILASASLYLALEGQRSCGCFGKVKVNPWATFALDISVMLALAIWRPRTMAEISQPAWILGIVRIAIGTAAILVVFGGVIVLALDSPAAVLARLRGEVVAVEPGMVDLGEGVRFDSRQFTIQLTNYADQPVQFLGGTANCSCIATTDLPITVPARESRSIRIDATFRGGTGRFQHTFTLYTDNAKQPVVIARFAGRVVDAPTP
jgi:hypothetical protein